MKINNCNDLSPSRCILKRLPSKKPHRFEACPSGRTPHQRVRGSRTISGPGSPKPGPRLARTRSWRSGARSPSPRCRDLSDGATWILVRVDSQGPSRKFHQKSQRLDRKAPESGFLKRKRGGISCSCLGLITRLLWRMLPRDVTLTCCQGYFPLNH